MPVFCFVLFNCFVVVVVVVIFARLCNNRTGFTAENRPIQKINLAPFCSCSVY